jgi:hypothetical protein
MGVEFHTGKTIPPKKWGKRCTGFGIFFQGVQESKKRRLLNISLAVDFVVRYVAFVSIREYTQRKRDTELPSGHLMLFGQRVLTLLQ